MVYASHLIADNEMQEIIEQTGMGVESIDFSIADVLDHWEEHLPEYKERLHVMEAAHLTLHGPFLDLNPAAYDSQIRQVTRLRFDQSYEAARELGVEKIIYHSCYYPQVYFLEGWAERVAEFMNQFLEGRSDIEVALENVLDPKWESLKVVADQVEADNFGLCLDIGHANCYSAQPVEEWAQGLNPYLTHIHVHDNHGDRDAHLALGDGNLKWKKIQEIFMQEEKRRRETGCKKEMTYTIECASGFCNPGKNSHVYKNIYRFKGRCEKTQSSFFTSPFDCHNSIKILCRRYKFAENRPFSQLCLKEL